MHRWTWIGGMIAVVAVAALISQNAVSQNGEAEPAPEGLKSTGQKMSYFIGFQVGSQFSQLGVAYDQDALLSGLKDALNS